MSTIKNTTPLQFDRYLQDRELRLILIARDCEQELYFDDWGCKKSIIRISKTAKFESSEVENLVQNFGFKEVKKGSEITLSFSPDNKSILNQSLDNYIEKYESDKLNKLLKTPVHASKIHLTIYLQFLKDAENLGCIDKRSNNIKFDLNRVNKYLKKDDLEPESFRFQEFLLQMENLGYIKIRSNELVFTDVTYSYYPMYSFSLEILKPSQEIETEQADGLLITAGHKIKVTEHPKNTVQKTLLPKSNEKILFYNDQNRKIKLNGLEHALTKERYKTAKVLIDNANKEITNETMQVYLECSNVTVRQRISVIRRKYFKSYIPDSSKHSSGYILNISPKQIAKY